MSNPNDVAAAVRDASRHELTEAAAKIRHCLSQLSDDDIWWRPNDQMNAIGNLILHVCGNMSQWLVGGIGGANVTRDRPAEFAERRRIPRDELLAKFDQTISAVDAALAKADGENLVHVRTVQNRQRSGAEAIVHSVSHLVGHMQEIIYITRTRLGGKYEFRGRSAKAH